MKTMIMVLEKNIKKQTLILKENGKFTPLIKR